MHSLRWKHCPFKLVIEPVISGANDEPLARSGCKASLSELLLDACVSKGTQVITRYGTETAVFVPIAEWKRLREAARPTLKSLLLSDVGRVDLVVPPRGQARRRAPACLSDCKT